MKGVGYIGEGSEVLEVYSSTFDFPVIPWNWTANDIVGFVSFRIGIRESRSTYYRYLRNHAIYLLLSTAAP